MTVIVYFIPFAYMFAASWKYGRKWSAGMGMVVTIVSIVVSLIPPGDVRSVWLFEFKLLAGSAALIVAARIMFRIKWTGQTPGKCGR
jgi:hypothetical protein